MRRIGVCRAERRAVRALAKDDGDEERKVESRRARGKKEECDVSGDCERSGNHYGHEEPKKANSMIGR